MPRPSAALLVALALAMGPTSGQAQEPVSEPLEIGAVAPDFELPGATRYGFLKDPVRLSDFKGKTVVLAFFYRARTKG